MFEDIGAFSFSDLNLEHAGGGVTERLEAMPVSANLFQVLGVSSALGQPFSPEQNEPGRQDAVILSDGLWRSTFAADPGIVGRTLRMNGRPYRVQGVMPPGFAFTIRTISTPDVWLPLALPAAPSSNNGPVWLVARLKPGVSLEQAQANIAAVAAGIQAAFHPYTGPHGEDAGYGATVEPLRDQLFGNFETGMLVLAGAVLFVLLIACANVANLQLARGARRHREIAVRAALGATRLQLLGELAAESLLLALCAAACGILMAWVGIRLLPSLAALPVQTQLVLDTRVLAFTAVLLVATALLSGLAPALHALNSEFSLAGGRTVLSGGRNRLRSSLVAAEVALSVALLAGAGLLLKSFLNLQSVDPGFDARNVLTVGVTLVRSQYRTAASQKQFFDRLIQSARAIPGVESIAFINILPLIGGGRGGDPFSIQGRPYDSSGRVPQFANRYRVSPDYFRVMRIPLFSGRLLRLSAIRRIRRPSQW